MAERQEQVKLQEKKIVEDARKAGAEAHIFDPNASPAAKAAQAAKNIPPGLITGSKPAPKAVPTDASLGSPNGVTNGKAAKNGLAITTNGAAPKSPGPLTGDSTKTPKFVNGDPKAGDGEWGRTGWEPRLGSLNDALGVAEAQSSDHSTWVDAHLDDKFFGDWYHNAGVIAFACLSTWFITKIGGGLAWIILIGSICATYYRTSIKRVRRNVRDDLARQFAKQRLDTDVETLEWINSFVVKFWPIYQPVLAATVINTVDGILAASTPGFLDSLRLKEFNLGTKPPRLDSVKTYVKTDDETVEMDWRFSFTPNDVADLTSRQLKNKINPKIILEVRVGKGIVSQGIPIIVENMAFSGLMKFKIKLQIPFPHIEKVEVCFLEKPEFDFVLKPLGGETFGFDIGFLPGLSTFIKDQVHANLGPMFYAPNIFTVELAKMMGGTPIDAAIGVLQLTIHNAQGLKNTDKIGGGTPDPYVVCSIDHGKELARTKVVQDSESPRFNETKHIILTSWNGSFTMTVFDFNDFRKDKELGTASFDIKGLEIDAVQENVVLPIMSGTKQKGQITCDFRFFPVLEGTKLDDGTIEPPPETNTGIVRFTVSQAKDLDATKSMIGQLSPYAVMLLNNKEIHTTKTVKRKNSPVWEEFQEILVTNRAKCTLGLQVKDERELSADPLLGSVNYSLDHILKMMEKGEDWFNLAHAKTGKVKMRAQWKPVALKGALGGSGGYITPIGVARVHFKSAKDLPNLETVGKSDPYGRVMLNGIEKAKTVTFNNDLNPKWDEVLYIPVHTPREKLMLEVMDFENMGKDRSLGHCELSLDELIKEGEDGLWAEHSAKVDRSEPLILGKKGPTKARLNFTVAFYPCLNIVDLEEEAEEKKAKEAEDKENATKTPVTPVAPEAESPKTDKDADSADGDEEKVLKEVKKPEKIRLTPEQLLRQNSGLLIFKIHDGSFNRTDTHLEVIMDDMLFPSYSSAKIRSKTVNFDETGDAFVRELDFSKVTIRLREAGGDKDHEEGIVCKLTGGTLDNLHRCLNKPTELNLRDKEGNVVGHIKVTLKYIPVVMQLDPSESMNNMGTVKVEVLDASGLLAADRGGKSDPYCVFELNDDKVFKSQVIKKTLNPTWNEKFEAKVPSRTAAEFFVKVYDWDLAGDDDFLGMAKIDLAALEPNTSKTVTYKLTDKKGKAGNFGEIRLRFLFRSDYIVRSRQGSSTFSGTFAAVPGKVVMGVAGAPLKGVGLAASGIGKGASFIKRGLVGGKKGGEASEPEAIPEKFSSIELAAIESSSTPQVQVNQAADNGNIEPPGTPSRGSLAPSDRHHRRTKSVSSNKSTSPSRPDTSGSGAEQGVATIRLVSASGYAAGLNLRGRIRVLGSKTKEILKSKSYKTANGEVTWDETCTVTCAADQSFQIYLEDDKFFDKAIGDKFFVVDNTGSGKDIVVQIGDGQVTLRTSFKANGTSENGGGSNSPKRRGLLGKKSSP